MVCDDNSNDQRLPYNNIYSNVTRPSSSETISTDNSDYSSSIETVEAASGAGGATFLQNGEPPQVEGKRHIPRKVPTRYVLVIMGFLAFVNMYMMYLNITVAWPAMVNQNATKFGALDDQTAELLDTSRIDDELLPQKYSLQSSQTKNSHRTETHKQRKHKRKRKNEAAVKNKNINKNKTHISISDDSKLLSLESLNAMKHRTSEVSYFSLLKPPTDKIRVGMENSRENTSNNTYLDINNTAEVDSIITTDPPVKISSLDIHKIVGKEGNPQNKSISKKENKRRRRRNAKKNITDNTTELNTVQVISIVPKVVIKTVQNNVFSKTPTPIVTKTTTSKVSSTIENSTEDPYSVDEETTQFVEMTKTESTFGHNNSNFSEISESEAEMGASIRDTSDRTLRSTNFVEVPTTKISDLISMSSEDTIEISETTSNITTIITDLPEKVVSQNVKSIGNFDNETYPKERLSKHSVLLTAPNSITTETISEMIDNPEDMFSDVSNDFNQSRSGFNISLPLTGNAIKLNESVISSNSSSNNINEYIGTVSGVILPILKGKLPLISKANENIRNNIHHINCLIYPKLCTKTNGTLEGSTNNTSNVKETKYHVNDVITPPEKPLYYVRKKTDDSDESSEEDSDEYHIQHITFNFGNHEQYNNCTRRHNITNCSKLINLLSMSIFFDHSSSSSSSEEDDDEDESDEDDDDDEEEDEGGEEDDDEIEEEVDEHEDEFWDQDVNDDDNQFSELYFDNSTNLFKRYDQNGTASEQISHHLDKKIPSKKIKSTYFIDEYEREPCEESSEECSEETTEDESAPTEEVEVTEEEEGTEEDSSDHRSAGLITLDNEKIPSTVCFYKKKVSTTFDGYDEGEFAWAPHKLNEVTSAYYWGLLVTQLLAGRLTGMFGGKIILVQAILLAGIITLLTPLLAKAGLYWLLTGRLLLGMMLGLVMPAMHALLAKWSPPLERTKMVAYTYSGIAIGAAVGGPLSAYLVQRIGWRLLFYGQGITAILWCTLFLLIIYESPNKHKRISQKEKQFILSAIGQQHSGKGLPVPWCNIIRCRHVFSLMLAQGAFVWTWHTLLHYAPLYISSVLHQNLQDVHKVWAAALCCMFVATCVYATIADWARKSRKASTITIRRAANSICSLITAVFLVGVAQSYCNTEAVKVCFALAIAMGLPGALCGIFPNSLDLAPNHAAAIAGISGAFATTANLLAPYYWQLIVLGQSTLERWRTIWYTSAIFLLLANCLYFLLVGAREQRWNRPIVVTKQPRRGEETTGQRRPSYAPYKNQAYVSTEHL